MYEWVDALYAQGSTNFVEAFNMAYAILEKHSPVNACHRSIMFLTDGIDTGDYTQEVHDAFIKRSGRTRVFTYSFGDNADETWPKKIACETEGIWYRVRDNENIANVMAKYYEFYASLMTSSSARWIEYWDSKTFQPLVANCRMTYRFDEEVTDLKMITGVTCVDLNLAIGVDMLRNKSDYPQFKKYSTNYFIILSICKKFDLVSKG